MKNYIVKPIKNSLIVCCAIFISGCELLPQVENNIEKTKQVDVSPVSYYGGYYLWIRSLSETELLEEFAHQKKQSEQGDELADMHLSLLFSLSKAPFHNPYTAKSKLNQQQLEIDSSKLDFTDFSFVIMLKAQLNQQLLALNKLILKEKKNTELLKKVTEQQQLVEQLEAELMKLKEQIMQLKNIEKNINNHG